MCLSVLGWLVLNFGTSLEKQGIFLLVLVLGIKVYTSEVLKITR